MLTAATAAVTGATGSMGCASSHEARGGGGCESGVSDDAAGRASHDGINSLACGFMLGEGGGKERRGVGCWCGDWSGEYVDESVAA